MMITAEIFQAEDAHITGQLFQADPIMVPGAHTTAEEPIRHGIVTDPALNKEYQTVHPDQDQGMEGHVPGQEEEVLANNL